MKIVIPWRSEESQLLIAIGTKLQILIFTPASTSLSDRVSNIHVKASTTLSQHYSAFLQSDEAFFNLQIFFKSVNPDSNSGQILFKSSNQPMFSIIAVLPL